jgi:large subunit ribosomal protein L10
MRLEKTAIVDEVRGAIDGSEFVILTGCRGLKVQEISDLRARLRGQRARLMVVKNTFLKFASEQLGRGGMDSELVGPTAMITGEGEVTEIAKLLKAFAKEHDKLEIKGGLLGKQVLSAGDVQEMAVIPPREIMLSRLVGTIAAPMTQLVGVMNQKVLSLLYVLKAVQEKKDGGDN